MWELKGDVNGSITEGLRWQNLNVKSVNIQTENFRFVLFFRYFKPLVLV